MVFLVLFPLSSKAILQIDMKEWFLMVLYQNGSNYIRCSPRFDSWSALVSSLRACCRKLHPLLFLPYVNDAPNHIRYNSKVQLLFLLMIPNCTNPVAFLVQKMISKLTTTTYKNEVTTAVWNLLSQNFRYCMRMFREKNLELYLNMN